jgi:hypothetical protein
MLVQVRGIGIRLSDDLNVTPSHSATVLPDLGITPFSFRPIELMSRVTTS